MRVRVGSRQLQVLRLLYTHRLLTAAQVHALAFEMSTRRTCEICLQRLHRKGWGGCGPSPCTAVPGAGAAATSMVFRPRELRCSRR